MGLANTEAIGGYMLTDTLNPRQLSEAAGLDYELTTAVYALYAAENDNLGNLANLDEYQVPLLDLLLFLCDKADSGAVTLDSAMQEELDTIHSQLRMAQDQLQGTAYDRLVVALALPEEGEETFAFLQTLHDEAARFYGPDAVLLVGNSTSDYDLATTFASDQRTERGVRCHCAAVHLPVGRAAPAADPGHPGQHLAQLFGAGPHRGLCLFHELPHRHRHPDGCEYRLCHCGFHPLPRLQSTDAAQIGRRRGAEPRFPHHPDFGQHSDGGGLPDRLYHHSALHYACAAAPCSRCSWSCSFCRRSWCRGTPSWSVPASLCNCPRPAGRRSTVPYGWTAGCGDTFTGMWTAPCTAPSAATPPCRWLPERWAHCHPKSTFRPNRSPRQALMYRRNRPMKQPIKRPPCC